MQTIYLEKNIKEHPRAKKILQQCGAQSVVIECDHYGEVFNRRNQNFRIQKQRPALILAEKTGKKILNTPAGYGIGSELNYYFSTMLNCLYDCRYCFLQGLYPSAHYVVFVNYEDFSNEMVEYIRQQSSQTPYFFSGYDGDSLAFDAVSGFADYFIDFFAEHPQAVIELRTKSAYIEPLLKKSAISNCVVAFSFTPYAIAETVEHKTPPIQKRLRAMQTLAAAGWPLGIRLDPLIYDTHFKEQYSELIADIFKHIPSASVHSITLGPLRYPTALYQRIYQLYPDDKFLAKPLHKDAKHYSYEPDVEKQMKEQVLQLLKPYVTDKKIFVI